MAGGRPLPARTPGAMVPQRRWRSGGGRASTGRATRSFRATAILLRPERCRESARPSPRLRWANRGGISPMPISCARRGFSCAMEACSRAFSNLPPASDIQVTLMGGATGKFPAEEVVRMDFPAARCLAAQSAIRRLFPSDVPSARIGLIGEAPCRGGPECPEAIWGPLQRIAQALGIEMYWIRPAELVSPAAFSVRRFPRPHQHGSIRGLLSYGQSPGRRPPGPLGVFESGWNSHPSGPGGRHSTTPARPMPANGRWCRWGGG